MKRIDRMQELEPFGVIPLTGESDVHMHRILCDVTAKGKAIVERTLATELKLSENWNSGKKDDPHVGSLLLPFEFVPSIAVFALLSDTDVSEVWLMKGGAVFGFGVEDVDLKERLRTHHEGEIRQVFYPRPNDRNLHVFTGRRA
ncbi:MAG: hypothetical protein IT428_30490 [Planctomycetaceae bacterium]|nr:hypothetical protein [Planctomycetaceae bacterium]